MSNREDAGSNPAAPAIKCPNCDRVFSKMGIKSHIWRAHGEGKGFTPIKPGTREAWNKGKTKATDERVARSVKKLRGKPSWCAGRTKDTDTRLATSASKISVTVVQKIAEGTWHNSFSRSRQHIYKGEKFDGRWELMLAKWFDEHGVRWVRNKKAFPYTFDKQRSYVPDFWLPDFETYLEVKGWKTLKDEAKWSQFPEALIILSGTDLVELGIQIAVKKDWKCDAM